MRNDNTDRPPPAGVLHAIPSRPNPNRPRPRSVSAYVAKVVYSAKKVPEVQKQKQKPKLSRLPRSVGWGSAPVCGLWIVGLVTDGRREGGEGGDGKREGKEMGWSWRSCGRERDMERWRGRDTGRGLRRSRERWRSRKGVESGDVVSAQQY